MTTRQSVRENISGKNFLSGGLNSTDNPIIVPFNEMVVSENILLGSTIARRKRFGTTRYCTDSAIYQHATNYPGSPDNAGADDPIRGIHEWWRYASGVQKSDLVLRQGTKVWTIEERTTVAVNRTAALSLSSSGRICITPFENSSGPQVYVSSTATSDGVIRWDGGAGNNFVAATVPPDGAYAFSTVHRGRMWAAGNLTYPYRLYYSVVRDGDDWTTSTPASTAAGSLDLDAIGDPKGITGIISFQDRLYVFMKRAIYEITGDDADTFFVRPITREVGCVSHATIKAIGNDVLFASDRGIMKLSSSDKAIETETAFVSRPIQRTWNEGLNFSILDQAWAEIDELEGLYCIAVPSNGVTTNDVFLTYNLSMGTWNQNLNHNARSMCSMLVSGKPRLLLGQENGRLVLTGERSRTDLGANYNARFKTGVLYPNGESDIQHVFKSVTILAAATAQTSITLQWEIDGKIAGSRQVLLEQAGDLLGTSFVLGSSRLSTATFNPRTIQISGSGYGLQLQILMPGDSDIEFYGFIIESVPAEYKHV